MIRVAETEHFVFFARTDDGHRLRVDPDKNERVFRDLARKLGVETTERTEYYRHAYPEQVMICSGFGDWPVAGVANSTTHTIHSVYPAHPHEIVHILSAKLGTPGRFFDEGLAVALGDQGKISGYRVDRLARSYVRQVRFGTALRSFDDVDPGAAYSMAGSFMGYLIRRHGLRRVVEFFRAFDCEGKDRNRVFAAVFHVPLEDAVQDWMSSL